MSAKANSPSHKRTEVELEGPRYRVQPPMNKVLNSEATVAYALTVEPVVFASYAFYLRPLTFAL